MFYKLNPSLDRYTPKNYEATPPRNIEAFLSKNSKAVTSAVDNRKVSEDINKSKSNTEDFH